MKYAVVIGINRYPHYAAEQQLGGCVNDARRMKQILVDYFGFDESNIRELLDEAASRQGILDAMEALIRVVRPDDIVVFHYSGHGRRRLARLRKNTALRPTDGDWFDKSEGTGYDSTLMPSDTGPAPHPHLDITDNTINNWLQRLTRITGNVTLIFDACHSGTVTRSSTNVKVRTLPPDDRPPLDEAAERVRKGNSGWLPLSDRYTVISGSRDSETSKEMDFDGESPFKRHGALSYYLTNELTRAVPGTTHRDVFEIAGAEVTKHFRTQHPQIEGVLDREIFGSRVMRPMRYLPLLSVDGDTAMLGGGGIHDLRAGSEWDVYPRGTKDTEAASCVGRIELVEVGPLTSRARVVQRSGEIEALGRCVEAGGSGQIDAVGRYRRVLALEHEASELDVAFETFRVARDGSLEAAGAPEFEFVEGDRLAFEVTNNENTILFFSILSFGLDGEIGRLYPRGKSSEMISATRMIQIGAQRAKLRVNLDGCEADRGEQFYKAFFATKPIDLAWLCQDAPQESVRKAAQLSARRARAATRSSETESDRDDWTSITRSVVVTRRKG